MAQKVILDNKSLENIDLADMKNKLDLLYESYIIQSNMTGDAYSWKMVKHAETTNLDLAYVESLAVTDTNIIADSSLVNTGTTPGGGDNYTAACYTYLYFNSPTTVTLNCGADDESKWYLNQKLIGSVASCAHVALSYPFKAGVNELVCVYREGAGGDWWHTNEGVKNIDGLIKMTPNYNGNRPN